MADFESAWYRLVLLLAGVALVALWIDVGPGSALFGVAVATGTAALGPAVAAPLTRVVPRRWSRVAKREHLLHRVLGVETFGWVLSKSGWNRSMAEPLRGFSGKRAGLVALELSLQRNVSAHGAGFAIHLLLTVLALFSNTPLRGALWMLVPGVVVHLYPVLLQRSILLRLQPLLARTAVSSNHVR